MAEADGSSASLERVFDALTETWVCPRGQRHPRVAMWQEFYEYTDADYARERDLRPPKGPWRMWWS